MFCFLQFQIFYLLGVLCIKSDVYKISILGFVLCADHIGHGGARILLLTDSPLGPIILPEVIIVARIFLVTIHKSHSNLGNVDVWKCMGHDIYEECHIVKILRVNMWMLKY